MESKVSKPDSVLFHDPIEDLPEFKPIMEAADRAASDELGEGLSAEYYYRRCSVKKQILIDRYDVDWLTPREVNPRVIFD